jgi:hypothetical protein
MISAVGISADEFVNVMGKAVKGAMALDSAVATACFPGKVIMQGQEPYIIQHADGINEYLTRDGIAYRQERDHQYHRTWVTITAAPPGFQKMVGYRLDVDDRRLAELGSMVEVIREMFRREMPKTQKEGEPVATFWGDTWTDSTITISYDSGTSATKNLWGDFNYGGYPKSKKQTNLARLQKWLDDEVGRMCVNLH